VSWRACASSAQQATGGSLPKDKDIGTQWASMVRRACVDRPPGAVTTHLETWVRRTGALRQWGKDDALCIATLIDSMAVGSEPLPPTP
jgi:hypothetical protein